MAYNDLMRQDVDINRALDSIERLKSLYASGYRSEVIDRSVAKLLDVERFAIERQLSDLRARISAYESQYGMSSSDFYAQFKSGKLGDDMDYFEWAVYCDMRDNALHHLVLLGEAPAQ